MFVKPAEGIQVRDPISYALLPAEGREVPESSYWTRRLADGDVVIALPAADVVPVDEQLNVYPTETEPS